MDNQREKEDAFILALCQEAGPELNADGSTTENYTDEEHISGFRGNHHPDLIQRAASGDAAALIELRVACGLPPLM